MRQLLAMTQTLIQIEDPCIPPMQREHDEYVMDFILNCNHYTPVEIRKLNYCHLYLEMVTVLDFTLPCGTIMDVDKAGCNPTGRSSRNSHLSVHQEKPSPA